MSQGFNHDDGSCDCGGHAVERTNRRTGEVFYGCDRYPQCKNTEPLHFAQAHGFSGDGLLSSEDVMECWAEAMTHDCGFK